MSGRRVALNLRGAVARCGVPAECHCAGRTGQLQHWAASRFLVDKLNILIYIYTGLYFVFSAWIIASDLKDKEPWWGTAADVVLLPLGAVGILLFVFSVNEPSLKTTWKAISILVVAGQLFTNVVSRHLTLAGKTDLNPERISQWAILGADMVVVLLLVPMFALNVLFAFS
jgi:hypothetical protein